MDRTLRMLIVSAAIATVAVSAATAGAGEVVIQGWAYASPGASQNTAYCAVDFGGDANYFVFGYKWNDGDLVARPDNEWDTSPVDANLGEGMLLVLDDQTDLNVGFHYDSSFGFFMDSFDYAGNDMGTGGYPGDWMGYWVSEDGLSWTYSGVGASMRVLTDGAFDGWSHLITDAYPPTVEPRTDGVFPEPATMSLLAVAGLALLRRRRR